MIIDTSNAPCGPGFLPGLRLSEGRFAINRKRPRFRGWGSRRQPPGRLRPPKRRLLGSPVRWGGPSGPPPPPRVPTPPSLPPSPALGPGRGASSGPHESGAAAGGQLVSALTALRVRKSDGDRPSGGLRGGPRGARRGTQLYPESPVRLPPCSRLGDRQRGSHDRPFSRRLRAAGEGLSIRLRPQIRRDNPLNLSILLSGGKETNQDSISNGE